jgi:hypothetical protein
MTRIALPYLAGCTLLIACGPSSSDNLEGYATTDQAPRMSELAARVAAITGQSRDGDQGGYAQQSGDVEWQAMAQDGRPMDPAKQQMATGTAPKGQGGMRTHMVMSPQHGVAIAQVDLPAHWNVQGMQSGNWSVAGPGLTVKSTKPVQFMFSTGQLGQFYQANNLAMRPPIAAEQVVVQDLAPRMRQQGYELVGQSAAPGVAQADQRGWDGLYVPGQAQRSCKVTVSEWRRGDSRLAVVLHWYSLANADLVNWGYYTTELEAPQARFEQEKNGLLAGLASRRYNPAYFAAVNRQAQQREQQSMAQHNAQMQRQQASWDAHNARMRANQAAFDARQAAHRDMVNGVDNAIMGTWNSTSSTMDRMQDATINGIRGEQNAWNPHTGMQGKVEAGYQNYWVNSDGQYFGTNDVMYDPNIHGQWVDQWQQMPTQP